MDFLAADILNKCGRAVPVQIRALGRTLTTILRRDRRLGGPRPRQGW